MDDVNVVLNPDLEASIAQDWEMFEDMLDLWYSVVSTG